MKTQARGRAILQEPVRRRCGPYVCSDLGCLPLPSYGKARGPYNNRAWMLRCVRCLRSPGQQQPPPAPCPELCCGLTFSGIFFPSPAQQHLSGAVDLQQEAFDSEGGLCLKSSKPAVNRLVPKECCLHAGLGGWGAGTASSLGPQGQVSCSKRGSARPGGSGCPAVRAAHSRAWSLLLGCSPLPSSDPARPLSWATSCVTSLCRGGSGRLHT